MILHDKKGRPYEHTFTGEEIAHAMWAHMTQEEISRVCEERRKQREKLWSRLVRLWRAIFPRPRYESGLILRGENGAERQMNGCVGGDGDDYEVCIYKVGNRIELCSRHTPWAFSEASRHPYTPDCPECVRVFDEAAEWLNRCHGIWHKRLPRSEWRRYGNYN